MQHQTDHNLQISEFNDIPEEFPGDIHGKVFYLYNITAKTIDLIFISVVPLVKRFTSEDQNQDVEEIENHNCLCLTDIGGPMTFL